MNAQIDPLQDPIVRLALDQAKLKAAFDTALPHLATRADVRGCEVRLIMWMISLTVAFAAAFGTWLHTQFGEMHQESLQSRQEMAQMRQEVSQTRQELQHEMAQMREQMAHLEQAVARIEERQQRR